MLDLLRDDGAAPATRQHGQATLQRGMASNMAAPRHGCHCRSTLSSDVAVNAGRLLV
uniref:Uncharacterized protein n=1 Tax=Arundo donax TaxID=35708 RepID=A0A0A9BU25_ARUDO